MSQRLVAAEAGGLKREGRIALIGRPNPLQVRIAASFFYEISALFGEI